MVRWLIVSLLVLVCPGIVGGATKYEVTSEGQSFMRGMPLQDTLALDITLTLDQPGTSYFGGALIGPSGLTITGRTYCSLVTENGDQWSFIVNDDAAYLNQPLSAALDFAAIKLGGGGAQLPLGSTMVMSLQVSGFLSLEPGRYEFVVGNSADIGAGAWWSITGDPVVVDSSVPFVIDVPEPAAALLLAGAMPFLRRRVA